ncbi:MAG: DUF1206 domain-containing protein [Flavobacterium sp.]|nr:MAG: DUF1206 domain-containing protein [Flavobacterium sp.]
MASKNSVIKPIAQAGLTAKGLVYCLLGLLAFMAAFSLGRQSADSTNRKAVFDFVGEQTGGKIMLGAIALGLVCYVFWRFFQAVRKSSGNDKKSKQAAKRLRYCASGVIYAIVAYQVIKRLLASQSGSKDSSHDAVQELLAKSYGEVVVGVIAAVLLIIGLYQVYYGLSEKYKKHVDKVISGNKADVLLNSGKIGYVARGVVWALMSFLLFRAAVYSNASQAGDTSKAFGFLKDTSYGSWLLAAVALGVICYGTFCFVRARYENFT